MKQENLDSGKVLSTATGPPKRTPSKRRFHSPFLRCIRSRQQFSFSLLMRCLNWDTVWISEFWGTSISSMQIPVNLFVKAFQRVTDSLAHILCERLLVPSPAHPRERPSIKRIILKILISLKRVARTNLHAQVFLYTYTRVSIHLCVYMQCIFTQNQFIY